MDGRAGETSYNFEEQCKVEEAVAPRVMAFLEGFYGKEATDKRQLYSEVDFECNGFSFDLKADTRMASTGKVFIETGSVVRDGKVLKQGWFYNANCDYILYCDVQNMKLLVIDLKLLRKHEGYILKFPLVHIQNSDYLTEGHLVPTSAIIYWLNVLWEKLPKKAGSVFAR